MMAHSSGWTGGAADALFGAGGCAVVAIVASARFRPSGGLLTFALGSAIVGLRTWRVVLAGPTPQERAIDGPAVYPTSAPAAAPIGPSTKAPDNAPSAASPTRSSAIAAEDIKARESATPAIVFLIRVPLTSLGILAAHYWSKRTHKGPITAQGRFLEDRGAAATLWN